MTTATSVTTSVATTTTTPASFDWLSAALIEWKCASSPCMSEALWLVKAQVLPPLRPGLHPCRQHRPCPSGSRPCGGPMAYRSW
eukprot:5167538-Alexandrium_andersonii.AAC.1